jgi:hypothetical protein
MGTKEEDFLELSQRAATGITECRRDDAATAILSDATITVSETIRRALGVYRIGRGL